MIAFLVACTLVIAFIVGCICISVRLYTQNGIDYPPGRQFVPLHQEASIGERSRNRPGSRRHVSIAESALRFAGVGLAVIVVVAVLVLGLFLIH